MNRNLIKKFLDRAWVFMAILSFSIFLTGCMDEDKNVITPAPLAYVSIYHAAPDAPGLDILIDNNRINTHPFSYSDFSGYLNFYTGNRNVKINSVNASNALIDTTFNVVDGKAYSIFIINRLSGIETLVVNDSAAVPATGMAMVRFVQLAPDAQALDVAVASENGAALFADVPFRQATDYKEVEAKKYSFELKSAGSSEVLLEAQDITLRPGGYYTIMTRGFVNPPAGNINVLSVEIL